MNKRKEICNLTKSIMDINNQLSRYNRNEAIRVLISARNNIIIESLIYETTQGPTVDINDIRDEVLYSKLNDYKIMCINKLNELINEN